MWDRENELQTDQSSSTDAGVAREIRQIDR